MSIKLVLLKSNETVITDLKELVDENEKVVSYLFENPYNVSLVTPTLLFEEDETVETKHQVSFYPWIVLSNDKQMMVNKDWIVSIVEPNEFVRDSYMQRMNTSTEGVMSEEQQRETLIENFEVITEEING